MELPYAVVGYQGRKCGVAVAIAPGTVSATGGCETGVAMRVVETRLLAEERL